MSTRTTRSGTKRAAPEPSSSETLSTGNTSKKRSKIAETSKTSGSADAEDNSNWSSRSLNIEEETGDIFDAPANTLIIHACNCQGHWGAGIAKAFKDHYPRAHEVHQEYCEDNSFALLDSAQLIPPVDAGPDDANTKPTRNESSDDAERNKRDLKARKHFVGCLFTSRRYGRQKDTPRRILAATKPAMEDLLKQVKEWNAKAKNNDERVKEVRMCKINSGLFAVPWEKSKKELESIDVQDGDITMIKVVSRAEE